MSYETIIFEVGNDHVATITLNRPERMNAFNQKVLDEMADAWDAVRRDDDVHAVVLRAAGDKALTPDNVIAYAREHLANYKVPRRVEVLVALPQNATGKVLKHLLRGRAAS